MNRPRPNSLQATIIPTTGHCRAVEWLTTAGWLWTLSLVCASFPALATAQELIPAGKAVQATNQSPPRPQALGTSTRELPAPKKKAGDKKPSQSSTDESLLPLNMDELPDGPPSLNGIPFNSASDDDLLDGDPLREFRKLQEDHLLRTERAKLEARARFESRSRDLIPRLHPTQSEKQGKATDPKPVEARKSPILPPKEEKITSPSDRTNGDQLNKSGSKAPTRTLPPPLRKATPVPNKAGTKKLEPKRPEPLPTPRATAERTETLPSRLGKTEAPDTKLKTVSDSKNEDAKQAGKEQAKQQTTESDSARSVLGNPAPTQAAGMDDWSQIVHNEVSRWTMPSSHTPYAPIQFVTCSTCGGCVDRNGVGRCDEFGTCLGVGTRARPKCQCWRCPQGAPFNLYGPGGYAGPARSAPMPEYRLRAGDQLQLTFMIKTVRSVGSYRLVVGDELLIEAEADEKLTRGTLERGLEIQPDGTITLRFIGQVHAAGQTIIQLRELLNERYEEYYPEPSVDVTPVKTGNIARKIREAISGSEGFNPQQALQRITPEGTIRLPRLGAVPTQGLTLAELKREINLRYDSLTAGLEVEVVLEEQAPHFIYVVGEVVEGGRFEIESPTTVLGAISLAQGYVPGANLRQVVVFRRGPNWELLSTMLDLRGALLAKDSRPPDEIWLQDGDVIIVPPSPIRLFDRFVSQVFTEGIYGIVPFGGFSLDNNN